MIKTTSSFSRARNADQKQERREAIIESALSLFVQNGFENVSLRDIATDVGLSKSNIYRYFESREHIYLIILQRSGSAWEKKAFAALKKLEGKGNIDQVAQILAHSFAASKNYCLLMTVINAVLEKNLSAELILNFRKTFVERRERLADLIAETIPNAQKERVRPLMFSIFAHVSGVWPISHPGPEVKKLIARPEYAYLAIDFETEVERFIAMLFKGAHIDAND